MISKLIKAGALAAAALFVAPVVAEAADMRVPVYKGVPRSVISYYNWTGFYVGATAGYASGTIDWTDTTTNSIISKTSPSGMLYGITAGYNWQAGSWVYGIEGDYSFSDISGAFGSNSWLATFRGRIGYAFDRFMPYFTGGGAYGDIKGTLNAPLVTVSDTRLGWTAGAGVEYAFLANWTVKGEYLYVDLGKATAATTEVGFNTHIVRGGLNYKF